jgi:hypothetical protein
VNQTYNEAWIAWDTLNISIATTVDTQDNSKLTMVATIVDTTPTTTNPNNNTTTGNRKANMQQQQSKPSDFALLLIPSFENGRVRCAFSGRNSHSRMPLDPTHVRLKRTYV